MWLEWVRFRHREQMQNPEAPDCPACGSNQLRAYTFRTRRLTGKEWLTLVLIPVCAVLGVFCQPLVKVLCGAVMNVHYLDTQEYAMAHAGLVQGLVIGLWLANLAVRYLRRKAGLRSTVFRCNQCRATFLPLGRNR
jgi:hypothetical protein